MSTVARDDASALARRALASFGERLALHADDIGDELARSLHLVAWDREQLIGAVQARLDAIAATRVLDRGGVPARIAEWRLQPLEALDAVWGLLVAGRRVAYEAEAGACSSTAALLAEASAELPPGMLTLLPSPAEPGRGGTGASASGLSASQRAARIQPGDPTTWPRLGVAAAVRRVAWIDADADHELAAYVLARTCLRRSGLDPRGVQVVYAAGNVERLQRQVQRLWVGAQFGPADDPRSFAGPVDAPTRDAFLVAHAAWVAAPGVATWCAGAELEHADGDAIYLAPAAFAAPWPCPDLPLVGPMCCIVACSTEQAIDAANAAAAGGAQVVQVGGRPGSLRGDVRHIRGAVLVERLPPGLPEPRPS